MEEQPKSRAAITRRLFMTGSATAAAAVAIVGGEHQQAFAEGSHSQPVPHAPYGGAGDFIEDPSQAGVSQSPHVVVTGDIDALPLEVDF